MEFVFLIPNKVYAALEAVQTGAESGKAASRTVFIDNDAEERTNLDEVQEKEFGKIIDTRYDKEKIMAVRPPGMDEDMWEDNQAAFKVVLKQFVLEGRDVTCVGEEFFERPETGNTPRIARPKKDGKVMLHPKVLKWSMIDKEWDVLVLPGNSFGEIMESVTGSKENTVVRVSDGKEIPADALVKDTSGFSFKIVPQSVVQEVKPKGFWRSMADLFSFGESEIYANYTGTTKYPPGVCGLRNMGNTCFMNSAIQCLSNTTILCDVFKSGTFKTLINKDNVLGTKGLIANEFGSLVQQMWSGNYKSVNPKGLKKAVSKFYAGFSGYAQQDAQEFLSFLLDGLHEDLNAVSKRPQFDELPDEMPDGERAVETWRRHTQQNSSLIVDNLHGLLKNTVTCPHCKKRSITFDPFMFLTVPLKMPNMQQYYLVRPTGDVYMHTLELPAYASPAEIRDTIAGKHFCNADDLILSGKRSPIAQLNDAMLMHLVEECLPFIVYIVPKKAAGEMVELQFECGMSRLAARSTVEDDTMDILALYEPTIPSIFTDDRPFELEGNGDDAFKVVLKDTLLQKFDKFPKCLEEYTKENVHRTITVDDTLRAFLQPEKLEKGNEWRCPSCKQVCQASKKLDLWHLPNILIVNLKRFTTSMGRRAKLKTPTAVSLEDWHVGRYVLNPDEKNARYRLYGVISHTGSLNSGHYVASCRNSDSEQWIFFNDSDCSRSSKRFDNAYVLFYEKIE